MSFIPASAVSLNWTEHAGRWYPHAPSPVKKRSEDDGVLLELHPGQAEPFLSKARFRVIVAGRRFGKTHFTTIALIMAAREKPKQLCWYVAPTYAMAKQIAWEKLKEITPRSWILKINENELKITLINRSVIILKGADKPDSLRGVGLNFLVLDEYQDMKSEVWEYALRATLTDKLGRAIFIGTPKSYNHLYTMYLRGQLGPNGKKNPQWDSWQFRTSDSPFIARSEIESARSDLDPKTFRQEYEASFESMGGRVYYDFDRAYNVRQCPYDPSIPTMIGQDFNIDPMSTVLLQRHGDEVWVTGELSLRSSSTEDVCRELLNEYGWDFKEKATVYPDPAGNAKQHARGDSDVQIFREWGFDRILFRKKHPPVRDRIAAVNRLICNAKGVRRLFVDPGNKELIKGLEQLTFKEGTNEPNKDLNIEHMPDALGYPIEFEWPVKRQAEAMGYSR